MKSRGIFLSSVHLTNSRTFSQKCSVKNASLLGNFEIVATTVIALSIFREIVSRRLWRAIILITLSSILLSFEGEGSFSFSCGSLFVIAATVCWGLENNCTGSISSKNTYQIVVLKGIFSGLGALIIALIRLESLPGLRYAAIALILGFASYGLSIFLYVRAQNVIGAARTSAYYAVAPFIGAFLSFVFLHTASDPVTADGVIDPDESRKLILRTETDIKSSFPMRNNVNLT